MMSMANQAWYDGLAEKEMIFRLAKECIAKIDAAGGAGSKPGGVEKVAKEILRIIRKKPQKTGV